MTHGYPSRPLERTRGVSSLLTKVEHRVALDPPVVVRLSTASIGAVVLRTLAGADVLRTSVGVGGL